ncbi:MAG TPA: hypothetical protein VK568_15530 [Thermodesulfobacteriota bacterium]|jgi:hypothetical protein|nr:hypothetical protein [Thermodesulfobacteriota bacterium]
MMNRYFDGTTYDSERLLKQLDSMEEEKGSGPKEIRLRFSERQYEKLKFFDGLELKEKLNIMYGVIDFIVRQVKNGVDI